MTELKPLPSRSTDQQLLEQEIARFSKYGWLVINRTDHSVQLRRPKTWSETGLVLAILGIIFGVLLFFAEPVIGMLLFAGGILVLIITVINYLVAKDKIVYFTVEDIKAGKVK